MEYFCCHFVSHVERSLLCNIDKTFGSFKKVLTLEFALVPEVRYLLLEDRNDIVNKSRGFVVKRILIIPTLFFVHLGWAQGNPCDCQPIVGELHPYRLVAKWETDQAKYHRAKDALAPVSVHAWQDMYSKTVNKQTVSWNTPRLKGTPEDSLYTLQGWLWYVRKEGDCDYHIQVGKKNKRAKRRAVVEVTVKNCALQQALLDTLRARGYTLSEINKGVELKRGILVSVVGLGFYDGEHGIKTPPKSVAGTSLLWKQEGTAWELHPVFEMNFEK
jgi:hypothetical protein